MAAFSLKVTTDKEAIKETGGGNAFIGKSGIYDVKINFASLEENEDETKQSIKFNLNVDYNGNTQVLYGSYLRNNDGKDNVIGKNLFNKLLIISGLRKGEEPDIEVETHKVGKDNKEKDFTVVTNLTDLEVKIQIKEVFTIYEGNVRVSHDIYKFFREDGATAEEIIAKEDDPKSDVVFGTQLSKIEASEATTKYLSKENAGNPAPTDEQIAEFIESKKSNKKSAPKASGKPTSSIFNRKK